MTDFDFDELDRAVNGAIGDEITPSPKPEVFTDELSTVEANEQPTSNAPSTATATSPAGSGTTGAPAARRSSGRFMDVVHPSSDMRMGATMPPRSAVPVVPVTPQPVLTQPTPNAPVWPSAATAQSDAPKDVSDSLIDDWQKPLESPFLPDAKVEKRPLGGEAPSAAEFDALELLEAPDQPLVEAHAMPDPIDFALSNEPAATHEEKPVLVQEPGGYGEGSFQPNAQPDIEANSEPEAFPEQQPQPVVQDEVPVEAAIPAGPASISQQYTAKPSSSPQPSAMYEAEAYQPAAPVVKKKPGAWAILWIVLILLLGAGAGAAFYFYVMPML